MSTVHGGSHLLQKYATARETRSSTLQGSLPGSTPLTNHTLLIDDNFNKKDDKKVPQAHAPVSSSTASKVPGGSEGDDSDTSAEGIEEDGDDDEDDHEPEAFAPSDLAVNLDGIQTGRTSVRPERRTLGNSKKRCLSGSSDEGDRTRRPAKVKKYDQDNIDVIITSDDEDYNAVDLISDSDEGEPTLEKMEEKMIIDSEEEHVDTFISHGIPPSPRSTSSEDWQGFELSDTVFLDDIPFFDEQLGRGDPDALGNTIDLYSDAPLSRYPLSPSPPPARHVRFADNVSRNFSSTSSPTSPADRDTFSDLFMQQDSLDPSLRLLIENDLADDNHSLTDGEGSHRDLDDNEDFELEKHGLEDYGSGDGGSSSGYETDEGETTDEEVLPPKTINRPQALLRLHSSSSVHSPSMPKPASTLARRAPVTPTPAMRRQGPAMASWVVDPTKPIALIDNTGKTMLIYPAPRSVRQTATGFVSNLSSSTTTSPRTSFAGLRSAFEDSEVDRSDLSSQEQPNSVFESGANLMLSGLLHGGPGMEHILGGQVLGPPEAFYPFRSINADGLTFGDNDFEDDDDDPEHTLNLQDFIDFGDDSSDNKPEGATTTENSAVTSPIIESPSNSFASVRGPSQQTSGQRHLQQLDKRVVSSFRRNHLALLRRPMNINATSGIKSGRYFAANNPTSPLRKRKASHSISSATNLFSAVTTKRRVTNKTYKRNKILS